MEYWNSRYLKWRTNRTQQLEEPPSPPPYRNDIPIWKMEMRPHSTKLNANDNYLKWLFSSKDLSKYTPPSKPNWDLILITAVKRGNFNSVKYAVEQGATILNPAFLLACELGFIEIVNFLIDPSRYINTVGEKGVNDWKEGLVYACVGGKNEVVLLLIKHGATNLDEGLAMACLHCHYETVKLLLEFGATDLDRGLAMASRGGDVRTVGLMINAGATDLVKALEEACYYGRTEVVELLLAMDEKNRRIQKADLNRGLHKASRIQNFELCRILREAGADNITK